MSSKEVFCSGIDNIGVVEGLVDEGGGGVLLGEGVEGGDIVMAEGVDIVVDDGGASDPLS